MEIPRKLLSTEYLGSLRSSRVGFRFVSPSPISLWELLYLVLRRSVVLPSLVSPPLSDSRTPLSFGPLFDVCQWVFVCFGRVCVSVSSS